MRKIFLVHWDAEEADALAQPLFAGGFEVEIEAEDGRRAYERVREVQPDLVLVTLDRKPAHGRELVRSLRQTKWGRELRVVMVASDPATIAKVREALPHEEYVEGEVLSVVQSSV